MAYNPLTISNGLAIPANSNPVATAGRNINGNAQTAPAVGYEFLTDSSGGWFDALGYSWISYSIATNGSVSAGAITFEGVNDTSATATLMYVQDISSTTANRISSLTLSASKSLLYEGPVTTRYIRARISTAVPAGTVTISSTLRQSPSYPDTQSVGFGPLPTSTQNLGNVTASSGSAFFGYTTISSPTATDIYNITYSSTTNTVGPFSLDGQPPAAAFGVQITNSTGTSVKMDVIIQESQDGVNFVDLYHFERIAPATTTYSTTPTIRLDGYYIRYLVKLSGTSPTVTLNLFRSAKTNSGMQLRNYFDHTFDSGATTLNSTTGVYYVGYGSLVEFAVFATNNGTLAAFQIQFSNDRSTWYNAGSPISTVSNTGTRTYMVGGMQWIRGMVSTTSTTQNLAYIQFTVHTTPFV